MKWTLPNILTVLRLLAAQTGLNLVADDTIDRRVTLKLRDVPWHQILDLTVRLYGLRAERDGNVLLVLPSDHVAFRRDPEVRDPGPRQMRLIRIRYAEAEDLAPIVERMALSGGGDLSVDERTNTLIVRDHPANIAAAIRLIGHD